MEKLSLLQKNTVGETSQTLKSSRFEFHHISDMVLLLFNLRLVISAIRTKMWMYVNVAVFVSIAYLLFVHGKVKALKKQGFIMFFLELVILSSYCYYLDSNNPNWYEKVDIFAHIMFGILSLYLIAALFPQSSLIINIVLALLIGIIYEICELSFGFFILQIDPFNPAAHGWSIHNSMQDYKAHFIGITFAVIIDLLFLPKDEHNGKDV